MWINSLNPKEWKRNLFIHMNTQKVIHVLPYSASKYLNIKNIIKHKVYEVVVVAVVVVIKLVALVVVI